MHDFNELLPEENAYPGIVQDLRTVYQLKPQEQRVLERVRERLAQRADAAVDLSSVTLDEVEGPMPVEEIFPLGQSSVRESRTVRVQSAWSRRLSTLVAVLVCCVLVGALAFVFAARHSYQTTTGASPDGISVLLAPTNGITPPQELLDATRLTLLQRFDNFGLQGSSVTLVTIKGKVQFRVNIPHFGGNEQQTIQTLTETGMLEFWDTGPGGVLSNGTTLTADDIASRYESYNNKLSDGSYVPWFSNKDLDPNSLSPSSSLNGRNIYQINFAMRTGDPMTRFATYTGSHIGDALTITLDDKVIASATIQSQISGAGQITGSYTKQQAQALVASLKAGALAVPLQQVENS